MLGMVLPELPEAYRGGCRTVVFFESVERHQPVTFKQRLAPGLIPGTAVTAGQQQFPGKL